MRAPGEIDELAAIAEPDYAIITGVEPVHLETMGSIENIARAKTEILAHIPEDGFALLNGDSRLLLEAAESIIPAASIVLVFLPIVNFVLWIYRFT